MERSWAYKKEVTAEQMELLHAHLPEEDARGMTYERCAEVAAALGLPYEAVRLGPVGFEVACGKLPVLLGRRRVE